MSSGATALAKLHVGSICVCGSFPSIDDKLFLSNGYTINKPSQIQSKKVSTNNEIILQKIPHEVPANLQLPSSDKLAGDIVVPELS